MPRDSLRKREVDGGAETHMLGILEEFGILESDAQELAIKMLANSTPFLNFIERIRKGNDDVKGQTRLIDVGTAFQQKFTRHRDVSWTEAVSQDQPDILRKHLQRDIGLLDRNVRAGWHSILTHVQDNRYMMAAAKTEHYSTVQNQGAVLDSTFPNRANAYNNIRHPSNKLETGLGLRSGRVHFFLADDALKNIDGIALHKSYLDAAPDELIVFTMHARFFFICPAKELCDWLKSQDARDAFGNDRLRIQNHRYPATEADINRHNPMRDFSIDDFLRSKGENIARIPKDRIGGAYLSAMDRTLQPLTPHLNWNTEIVAQQLDVHKRVSAVLKK